MLSLTSPAPHRDSPVQDNYARDVAKDTWRLGNLLTPNEVQKLPMASHAKDGENEGLVREPDAGKIRTSGSMSTRGCGNGATAEPLKTPPDRKGRKHDMLSCNDPR